MGRKKKRYGKIGWDYWRAGKYKALKKRRDIFALKVLGCVVLVFWLIIVPIIFIIKLVEQIFSIQILPK